MGFKINCECGQSGWPHIDVPNVIASKCINVNLSLMQSNQSALIGPNHHDMMSDEVRAHKGYNTL